jgi:hypothetical protein
MTSVLVYDVYFDILKKKVETMALLIWALLLENHINVRLSPVADPTSHLDFRLQSVAFTLPNTRAQTRGSFIAS